jgi:caffeoyl-CoA O-methyltransferase
MEITNREIEKYCIEKSNCPSMDCEMIENYTRENVHGAQMLIGKLEASLLGFLIQSVGVKRILELGTFTGYSALSMAEQLPDDGSVITLDINEKTVNLAKEFWAKAKHGHKIQSIIGEAINIIPTLDGHFDMAFIDADKRNYLNYLKLIIPRLSPKGFIVIDNVLWSGRVLEGTDKDQQDEHRNTKFIREVNDYISKDSSLFATLLPIRDGMFLIKKAIK